MATYSKACVYFNSGYYLEFEPANQRFGFPPEELVKLNTFAKKRSGVLFVHVQESPIPAISSNSVMNRRATAAA